MWGDRMGFTGAQRRAILAREPACRTCGAPSTEADHIRNKASMPPGVDPNTLDNGQALCSSCHREKTARETAEGQRRARDKALHPGARR